MWSEVDEEIKKKLKMATTQYLTASKIDVIFTACVCAFNEICNNQIPSDKVMLSRIKGYYGSRRNSAVLEDDEEKVKKRKLSMKASRRTYVSYLNTS
jgi:hypothetical protein